MGLIKLLLVLILAVVFVTPIICVVDDGYHPKPKPKPKPPIIGKPKPPHRPPYGKPPTDEVDGVIPESYKPPRKPPPKHKPPTADDPEGYKPPHHGKPPT